MNWLGQSHQDLTALFHPFFWMEKEENLACQSKTPGKKPQSICDSQFCREEQLSWLLISMTALHNSIFIHLGYRSLQVQGNQLVGKVPACKPKIHPIF